MLGGVPLAGACLSTAMSVGHYFAFCAPLAKLALAFKPSGHWLGQSKMRTLDIESRLLAEHGDLVVVNKPADWPTSGHSLDDPDCVQWHLIQHFGQMVWTVHQLDADTSGVCLFALDRKLVGRLQKVWGAGTEKEYRAIVHGEPGWEFIEERSPIGEVRPGCLGVHPEGKATHSVFTVLDRAPGFSLIQARIHTGRTHQIRIHLSHLGHSLVGEEWYRESPCRRHSRQALHALRIAFPDAGPLPKASFIAPIAEDLVSLAGELGLKLL